MTKTIELKATLMTQLGKGYRTRYTSVVPVIIAEDRIDDTSADSDLLADALRAQTVYKGVFVAPCNCQILRMFANAKAWPNNAAAGVINLTGTKVGYVTGDVALTAALNIEAASQVAETACDLTLVAAAVNMLEGEAVDVTIGVADQAITAKSSGLVVGIEFMPTEV
jgi:hypothetical protein